MVAKRQTRRDEPSALALVPERTPDVDAAQRERERQANRDAAKAMLGYIRAADAGDDQALAKLNDALDTAPFVATKMLSGLPYSIESDILDAFGLGQKPGSMAITRTQLDTQRRALLGERPSELERMIVGQLVRDWLWCLAIDGTWARKYHDGFTLETGEFWGKQRERAHRQFTATAKTLATIRAAQTPALAMIVQP